MAKATQRRSGKSAPAKTTTPTPASGLTAADAYLAFGTGKTDAQMVRKSNLWRDNYNPLRGLVMSRLVAIFEAAERGAYAELQLLLRKAEKRYPVLKGFIERLTASIEELEWDVKVMKQLPPGATPEMAEKQKKFLRQRYDLVTNLNDAIGQIALAEIRGYAVLQKHRYAGGPNDGAVKELYWLEPWVWSRDGFYGDFYYNEISKFGVGLGSCAAALGEQNRIGSEQLPREEFVLREVESPLYEIALIAFVNWMMGRKDYAAFVEIFGLAKGVVIMPPNIAVGKEADYQAAAEKVSDGVSGALPSGSDIKFPTAGVRGESPFEKYCEAQDRDFVMAATSGVLSMLEGGNKGGLNAGPHKEHGDEWNRIAKMKGKRVNETLQRDFDAQELAAAFPGEPVCVYFELAVKDGEDVGQFLDNAVKLEGIGYQTDEQEIAERTGMKVKRVQAPSGGEPGNPGDPLAGAAQKADQKIAKGIIGTAVRNRATAQAQKNFAAAVADDLQHLRDRIAAIEAISDDDLRAKKLQALLDDWDRLTKDITADPSSARVLEQINAAALVEGLQGKVKNRGGKIFNSGGNPDQARVPAGSPEGGEFASAPGRISVEEADRRLTEGFAQKDAAGREIKFGLRLKQHIEEHHAPQDAKDRKERLLWAQETVRSGNRVEGTDPATGEPRAYYSKFFSDQGKAKGFLSVVDTKDNEVFNAMRAHSNYIQKQGVKNRSERDETCEQPHPVILQAIAAAGHLPDCFKFNPGLKSVNP